MFVRLTFANKRIVGFRLPPRFLHESRTAAFALGSAGVVLAAAEQLVRILWVSDVARLGVSVAHAPSADGYVSDRVEEAAGQREIVARETGPLAEQSLGTQQPETDVGRFGPILQQGRVEEVVGRRTVVQQRHYNLQIFKELLS